jgi:hypothetical protein
MTLSRLAAPILATALATGAPVTGSPAVAQGNADLEGNVRSAFAAGDLAGLHGLYVALDDEVLADLYFPGADERWGMSLGPREHGPDTLHDLRSVTKSIVGLLYGIALSKGLVPSLSEPLIARFRGARGFGPRRPRDHQGPRRALDDHGHGMGREPPLYRSAEQRDRHGTGAEPVSVRPGSSHGVRSRHALDL